MGNHGKRRVSLGASRSHVSAFSSPRLPHERVTSRAALAANVAPTRLVRVASARCPPALCKAAHSRRSEADQLPNDSVGSVGFSSKARLTESGWCESKPDLLHGKQTGGRTGSTDGARKAARTGKLWGRVGVGLGAFGTTIGTTGAPGRTAGWLRLRWNPGGSAAVGRAQRAAETARLLCEGSGMPGADG
jgi:hypothetical protein